MAKWKEVPLITASEEWDSMVLAAQFALDRLTKKGDELADLVEETPSPEAIVRTALRKASDLADDAGTQFFVGGEEKIAIALSGFSRLLRFSLASDPAEVAEIIKKAGEDRG